MVRVHTLRRRPADPAFGAGRGAVCLTFDCRAPNDAPGDDGSTRPRPEPAFGITMTPAGVSGGGLAQNHTHRDTQSRARPLRAGVRCSRTGVLRGGSPSSPPVIEVTDVNGRHVRNLGSWNVPVRRLRAMRRIRRPNASKRAAELDGLRTASRWSGELPIRLPIQGRRFGGARSGKTRRAMELSRPDTTGRDSAPPT
jgi:hypothetical protein